MSPSPIYYQTINAPSLESHLARSSAIASLQSCLLDSWDLCLSQISKIVSSLSPHDDHLKEDYSGVLPFTGNEIEFTNVSVFLNGFTALEASLGRVAAAKGWWFPYLVLDEPMR
ncbi:hypothetical protein Ancab_038095 [Ancistrocladus abbreviatus]